MRDELGVAVFDELDVPVWLLLGVCVWLELGVPVLLELGVPLCVEVEVAVGDTVGQINSRSLIFCTALLRFVLIRYGAVEPQSPPKQSKGNDE